MKLLAMWKVSDQRIVMKNNQRGMTLVEVLATLVLLSLVTGVIWSTISIATKFNVAETSTLQLQKESNYIIAELQRIHRQCDSYTININEDFIEVSECKNKKQEDLSEYNEIVSIGYKYRPSLSKLVVPAEEDLTINELTVMDTLDIEGERSNRKVTVTTVISRYITDK